MVNRRVTTLTDAIDDKYMFSLSLCLLCLQDTGFQAAKVTNGQDFEAQ